MKKTLLFIILLASFAYTATAQVGFQPHTIIDQGSTNGPTAVFAADINNDGHLDLVSTSEYDSKVAWYKNDGAGNLGSQQIISLNELSPVSGEAVDIDNDGNIDILVSSSEDNKLAWFRNNGSGNFSPPYIISTTGDGASNAIAGDVDGDGDLDVIATSYKDEKIAWYENTNGQGIFGPENIISTTVDFARKVAAADLDGDGDLDVMTISFYGYKTVWFENLNGQGDYGSEQIIDDDIRGEYNIVAYDIDADGDLDIISNKNENAGIVYYENLNGQGIFSSARIITTDDAGPFVLNDIDHDGDMDILSQIRFSELVWYENLNASGSFGNKLHIADTQSYSKLNMADIDNNGEFDIFLSDNSLDKIAWYPSNGQGDFDNEIVLSIIEAANGVYDVHAADIDGDGNMDVVSANLNAKTITWFKNVNGQGDFSPALSVGNNLGFIQSIYPTDIDGDGDMDIISSSDENYYPTWYKNIDGLGNFEMQTPLSLDIDESYYIHADDLDGDGDMDIISGGSFDYGMLWFENLNGQGTFSPPHILDADLFYTESIYTADLDGDGDKDIVAASYSEDFFAWYENLDGQGNFGPRITLEENVLGSFSLYPSDLDSDGDIDLVGSVINENLLIWFENIDGNGNFSSRQILAENVPTAERIKTFDADQDGDQDILISDFVEKTYSWFENTDGLGTLGARQIFDSNIKGALGTAVADIDNNGTMDIVTGSLRSDNIKWYENFGRLGNDILGTVTLDLDSNGCTSNDDPMKQVMVVTDNGTHSFATFTQPNGDYHLFTNEGTFTTTLNYELPSYYSPNPPFHTSTFVGQNNSDVGNFCVEPTEVINDLNISFYPLSEARPGFEAEYQVIFNNVGTTVLDGAITVSFDDVRLDFLMASEPINSQTNSTVTFDYSNFKPFETRSIDVSFQVATPPTTQINDILVYNVTIEPVSGDLTEFDNSFTFEQTVIGSYDPNDIQVLEGESIFIEEADNYLHYIIRFQNTGTASAINVNVSNELDANFDWSTLQIERISHSNRVEITDGNHVEFIFNNINLPDSISNEPESHGYIQYKIKPKNNIEVGDFMQNSAAIFFDFNPPVITNTVITTVIEPLGVEENATNSITLYPVPTSDILNIKSTLPIVNVQVFNNLSQLLFTEENQKGIEQLNIEPLSSGIYFVKLTDLEQNSISKKFIKQE